MEGPLYLTEESKKKNGIVPNESYPGCQRLFMRGFRFRSSLKKSSAEDVSACSRRSSSSQARKKYLVPRVNESSFLIISLSINLYWLNLPCHVSIRLRRSEDQYGLLLSIYKS